MSKKTILAICITAVLSSGITLTAVNTYNNSRHNGFFSKLGTIATITDKYFIDDVDYEKVTDYAAYAMTLALDDPYTQYFDKEQFKAFQDSSNGIFVGVGIVVSPNTEKNVIEVISPIENSPAEKAGILAGDVILKANDLECTADNYNDIVNVIRGKEGEPVTLTVKRGDAEPFFVTIFREEIHEVSVKSKMLSDNIGYIRISEFDIDIDVEFKNQFKTLQSNGMQKLIIDVRNNPGGNADTVQSIADYFLPECVIMYTMDKAGNKSYMRSTEQPIGVDGKIDNDTISMTIPIVVLVNDGSASASEVLAGALQCHDRAEIVGTTTYGKGVIQAVLPFKDGSGMKVTYGKYYFSNDECIHKKGVTPDEIVELPDGLNKTVAQLTYEEDTQLARAMEILKNKKE